MKNRPRLLGVSRDPAGAHNVARVLGRLIEEDKVDCRAVGESFAGPVFDQYGLVHDRVETGGDPGNLEALAAGIIKGSRPDLVLTGTSKGPSLDKYCIEAASRQDIPALTLLDTWFNFAPRFSGESPSEHLRFLPDRIAAIDAYSKGVMVGEGFPEERILITGPGTPYLDDLADMTRLDPGRVGAIRAAFGTDDDEALVVFASQPLALDYGVDGTNPDFLGYTEVTALKDVVAILAARARTGERIRLVVKLHPREDADAFPGVPGDGALGIVFDRKTPPRECIAAAAAVVGMTSMFLVESVLMGKPTVSYQPGSRRINPLEFLSDGGVLEPALDPAGLEAEIDKALRPAADNGPSSWKVDGRAGERVVKAIYGMLAERSLL